MLLLSCNKLSKSFGDQCLFSNVTFGINEKDKIGLLGRNGVGKSTLLKIIAGEESSDQGMISIAKDINVGYMQQHASFSSKKTALQETLSAFSDLIEMEDKLNALQKQLEKSSDLAIVARHAELQDAFLQKGGLIFRAQAKSTLLALGLTENELNLPLSAISGGQRTRVLLAKLLLQKPQILLLDEPTNHLDLKGTVWLEQYLKNYPGTVLLISHDRYFLDQITNRIFDLEGGTLVSYAGNYSQFLIKKAEREKALQREYDHKIKEIHRLESIIEQQKRWNRQRNLVTARSKQKSIDRIEKTLVVPMQKQGALRMQLSAAAEAGNDILILQDLAKAFEEKQLFAHLNLHVRKGDKIAIFGENGCGKTTLFRMILGKASPDQGCICLGEQVQIGYYDQTQSNLNPNQTILEAVSDALPTMEQGAIRNALAAFLFSGDSVFQPIRTLSGGEKARVSLLILVLSKCNFLLLDEPTNHLDISSKEVLERALSEYDGTLLFISHDRYFLERVATSSYYMGKDGLQPFLGNYEMLLQSEEPKKKKKEAPSRVNVYQEQKENAARKRKIKAEISKLEATIKQYEDRLQEIEGQMQLPDVQSDAEMLVALSEELEALHQKTQFLYPKWEALVDQL